MNIAVILIFVVVALMGILTFVTKSRMKKIPLVQSSQKIIELTDINFKNQIKDKTILVDFWAEWCGPCRMMAPVLNEVSETLDKGKYIGKVDVQKFQPLAQQYKVRGIPTLILFKNGKEINRFVGVKNKEFLLKQFQNQ